MKLTIYETYAEVRPSEKNEILVWNAKPQRIGDRIDMGNGEPRWFVTAISEYRSAIHNAPIGAIELITLNLDPANPEERPPHWIPYVAIESAEGEFLEYGIWCDGVQPLGRLTKTSLDSNDERGWIETPRPWIETHAETFHGKGTYAAIVVHWCAPIPERELVAA